MIVKDQCVVSFHYRVKDSQGNELESSFDSDPALYLQGAPGMLPGVADALLDKQPGDAFEITLAPEQAYGVRRDNASERVSLKHVRRAGGKAVKGKLAPGTRVEVQTKQGVQEATVIKMGLKSVDIDTNHPFAGQILTFDIAIVAVREASESEIAHGHAHGVGGHQH